MKMNEELEVRQMNVKDIKILENSRLRVEEDLSELMESIKQVGLLQPILIRKGDNAVICGNRRLMAIKKLGLKSIDVRVVDLKSEAELHLMNLTENIQRKNISSVEIGRYCKGLIDGTLAGVKLTIGEISTRLGISENRVKVCLVIYEKVPDKIKKSIKSFINSSERKYGEIPETFVLVLATLNKQHKKIKDFDLNRIIEKIKNKEISNIQDLHLLARLLGAGMSLNECFKQLDSYTSKSFYLLFNKVELEKTLKKEKLSSVSQLVRKLLVECNRDLIY